MWDGQGRWAVGVLVAGAVLLSAVAWSRQQGQRLAESLPTRRGSETLLTQGTPVPAGDFPKTIVDASGARMRIVQEPRRIVTLAQSADEMVTDLVPVDRLAGVTVLVDNPMFSNMVGRVPKSVPRLSEDPESVLAARPDLVIVAQYTRPEAVRLLMAGGVPVVRMGSSASFDDLRHRARQLGRAVGAEAKSRALVRAFDDRLAKVKQRWRGRKKPRVLVYSKMFGSTSGSGTLGDAMVRAAGGKNTALELGVVGPAQLSAELALALQPDVIVTTHVPGQTPAEVAQQFQDDPRWRQVPAVRDRRIIVLPLAPFLSASLHVVQAVEMLADQLHEPVENPK